MSPNVVAGSRYLPLVKVGSGAFATVHVALDRGPLGVRQLVALKVLHPHLADEVAEREALVREARLLSTVRHPNVVELRDVDVDDGVRLVLGYVEGVTLGKWLVELGQSGGRIPTAVAVRIARDAALGLHAIHEATSETGRALGLVHRDVSPQNLLVGIDGVTRLSDFGTAKVLFEPTSETTEGSLKGKLGYMAPEYIRGAAVDRRIDVFALGVVVWETLTGRRLFRGSNEGETLDRILSGDVPAPSSVDPSLAPFDDALAGALRRDPRERTPTALALGRAIDSAAKGAGLDADHAAVGEAMRAVFDGALSERRAAVARAIGDIEFSGEPTASSPFDAMATPSNAMEDSNASPNGASNATASDASEEAPPEEGERAPQSIATAMAEVAPVAKPRLRFVPWLAGIGVVVVGGAWGYARVTAMKDEALRAAAPASSAPSATPPRSQVVATSAPSPAVSVAPFSAASAAPSSTLSAAPSSESSSAERSSVEAARSGAPVRTGKVSGKRAKPPPNPY